MHPTVHVLVLFAATVLPDDVSSHLFPPVISHMLTDEMTKNMEIPKDYKRQSDSFIQCVSDKLDAAFAGDNSSFASDCRFLEFELEGIDFNDTSSLQSAINSFYNTFCTTGCGDVIVDAYNDCGIGDGELSVHVSFLIGLCGTNQNGEKCYQKYGYAINLIFDVGYCYGDYTDNNACNCRSELLEAVKEMGCCHNIYHDYVNYLWQGQIKADELYDACNVDLPSGCNNSPIATGNSPTTAGNSPTTAVNSTTTEERGHGVVTQVALVPLMSVLIFSVLLG